MKISINILINKMPGVFIKGNLHSKWFIDY